MDTPTIIDILKIGIIYTLLLVMIFLMVMAFVNTPLSTLWKKRLELQRWIT